MSGSPRVAVIVFPGTWSDRDFLHVAGVLGWQARAVWHAETELGEVDAVVLPGGFAHGDYLRTGAIARFSPVMAAVGAFADAGRPGHRLLQWLPDPVRGRDAARRAAAQRPPGVPL